MAMVESIIEEIHTRVFAAGSDPSGDARATEQYVIPPEQWQTPHLRANSKEWLEELAKHNPQQAEMTRLALQRAGGREDVCSVCGDQPAPEYRQKNPSSGLATMRLCDDCRRIRAAMHGETWEPVLIAN